MGAQITINDNSAELVKDLTVAAQAALEKCGLVAEGYAKVECPVDTGRLRNSISHKVQDSEKAVYIGTNVEYAPYVELGTVKQTARPYLRPAIEKHTTEYRNLIISALKGGS